MFIQIAVADPLPIFRQGIMAVLSNAGFHFASPDDLLVWINDQERKAVLLTLQSADDWALLAEMHRTRSDLLILAVLPDTTVSACVRALTSGAVGVMPRNAAPTAVKAVFEAAVNGKALLPIDVLLALTTLKLETDPIDDLPSAWEIDWLHQLANGTTVGQLAGRAGYSERMVFRQLRDLYGRLGVKGRTDALMMAKERGWI